MSPNKEITFQRCTLLQGVIFLLFGVPKSYALGPVLFSPMGLRNGSQSMDLAALFIQLIQSEIWVFDSIPIFNSGK